MNKLPALLRKIRRERRMTQVEFAQLIGVDQSTISKWERGTETPQFRNYDAITRALGISFEELTEAEQDTEKTWSLYATVVGHVQAGDWVPAIEWPEDRQYKIQIPAPSGLIQTDFSAFEVRGDSMNLVYPEGAIIIVARVHDYDWELANGDKVVVIQPGESGDFEATVKEVVLDQKGRVWLWPRSTNPIHQSPIPYRANHDEFSQEQEAEVIGVVIASVVYDKAIKRISAYGADAI